MDCLISVPPSLYLHAGSLAARFWIRFELVNTFKQGTLTTRLSALGHKELNARYDIMHCRKVIRKLPVNAFYMML